MEREQITKWAFEAGMEWMPADEHCRVPHFDEVTLEELEAFAKLVADAEAKRIHDEGMVTVGHMREQVAKEREACAMVCETHPPTTTPTWVSYATAIRARGQ
jgi:hypothetical protein